MKFLCTVMYIVAMASSIGSSLGNVLPDDNGGPTLPGGGDACDVQLEVNDTRHNDTVDVLMDRMLNCLREEANALKHAVTVSHTTEEYRNVFKTACEKLPTIGACTADVASNVHRCLNESNTSSFKVVRNDLDVVMTVACEQDGVKVAAIVQEVRELKERSVDNFVIVDCLKEAEREIRDLGGNDPSKVSVSLFRLFKVSKTCIADREQGQNVLNNLFESFFSDVMSRMKCIHPVSHAEVLCNTFVDN